MFERAIELINRAPGGNRRLLLRALHQSICGDGELPPKVLSPLEIEDNTGVPLRSLYNFGILIDKTQAVVFLDQLGFRVGGSVFRKRASEKRYREALGRRHAAKVGNKLVFSYLEIVELENVGLTLEPPIECISDD